MCFITLTTMIKDTLGEIVQAGDSFDSLYVLKKSGLKKSDVKPLADQGDLNAQLVLLLGLTSWDIKTWMEDFEDEETHEVIPIERSVRLDTKLFESDPDEVDALSSKLLKLLPTLDDDTLRLWWKIFDDCALYPAIPKELAKRGDATALSAIGYLYADGFEDIGYAKDKEKARYYFNKALAAGWDNDQYDYAIELLDYDLLEHSQDLADDFDPHDAIIMISGHPLYIDQIEYMLEDLTKAHGLPFFESDYAVPLQYVFKTLGFDWVENTGNLIRYTRHSEPVLTLEIEANPHVDEALMEAFQKAYPKLTIKSIDNAPGA